MEQSEVDKIIAEALADSKKKSRWHKPSSRNTNILKIRNILNWTFMALFAVAVIVYFMWPEQRTLFFCLGFGAMLLKIVEFFLRFMF